METGDGLNILLVADYVTHHNWMSFLSWYSFHRNLPDAKFNIVCNRKLMTYQLFGWTKKCGVPFTILKENTIENHIKYLIEKKIINNPILVIKPEILAVRELNFEIKEENLTEYVNAKENKISTFVNYQDGFGKFKLSEWINKDQHPFIYYNEYFRGELSLNELKIEELWKKATPLFVNLIRN